MNNYQRHYREYLRGVITGLNSIFSTKGKYFDIKFASISNLLPLKESIADVLIDNHWVSEEIPELELMNKGSFRACLVGIFQLGINLEVDGLVNEIIFTLDSEFGDRYRLYCSSCSDEEEEVLVIALETSSEILLITLSYAF